MSAHEAPGAPGAGKAARRLRRNRGAGGPGRDRPSGRRRRRKPGDAARRAADRRLIATEASAAGRAILSLLPADRRAELLGREPEPALLDIYAATRQRGYSISEWETDPGATSLGSPLIDYDGHPCGAVCIIGPCERLDHSRFDAVGALLIQTARTLSRDVAAAPA